MRKLIKLTKSAIRDRARAAEARREMDAIREKVDEQILGFNRLAGGPLNPLFIASMATDSDRDEELLQDTDTESAAPEPGLITQEEQDSLLAESTIESQEEIEPEADGADNGVNAAAAAADIEE